MATSLTNVLPPTPQTSSQSSRLLKPNTQTIPRNASIYNHIHTPLVLGYYALRFSALVADPLQTMIQDLLPVTIAQCAFCATCLPAAGTWGEGKAIIAGTGSSKGKGSAGSTRRKGLGVVKKDTASDVESWGSKVVVCCAVFDSPIYTYTDTLLVQPTMLSLILTLTIPTIPLFVLSLVLGAPLWPYSQLPHTLLLAVHVSLLAFLPIFYTHGVDGGAWRDVMAAWLPFDHAGVWAGTIGCFVGGWVGAVPIALDWDREWQKWPCTVLVGVVLGWAMGRMLTGELRLGVGKRIDLGEQDFDRDREVVEEKKGK
jgi:GPI ethanolamine phosphate transferase 2/3 subunit F